MECFPGTRTWNIKPQPVFSFKSKMLIHNERSKVYKTEDGFILKVAECSAEVVANSLFISHFCSREHFMIPLKITVYNEKMETLFEEGTRIERVDTRTLCVDLIKGLVQLEEFNLTHGDIKLNNVVFHDGKYKWIDFDILPNIYDNTYLSQSYNDHYGAALVSGLKCLAYSTYRQAMYAFGITLATTMLHQNIWISQSKINIRTNVNLSGLDINYLVPKCAKEIYENEEKWLDEYIPDEWRTFIQRLVGKDKFSSFKEAAEYLNIDVSEFQGKGELLPEIVSIKNVDKELIRKLYEKCADLYALSLNSSRVFDLFYRFEHLFEDKDKLIEHLITYGDGKCYEDVFSKIHQYTKGSEITWCREYDCSGKLLNEWKNPGSWLNEDRVELDNLMDGELPKKIIRKTFVQHIGTK